MHPPAPVTALFSIRVRSDRRRHGVGRRRRSAGAHLYRRRQHSCCPRRDAQRAPSAGEGTSCPRPVALVSSLICWAPQAPARRRDRDAAAQGAVDRQPSTVDRVERVAKRARSDHANPLRQAGAKPAIRCHHHCLTTGGTAGQLDDDVVGCIPPGALGGQDGEVAAGEYERLIGYGAVEDDDDIVIVRATPGGDLLR